LKSDLDNGPLQHVHELLDITPWTAAGRGKRVYVPPGNMD